MKDAGSILQILLALGGFTGIATLVNAWLNRRKPRADVLQTITLTATELVDSLREEVERLREAHREQVVKAQEQDVRIQAAEQRLDIADTHIRELERYAYSAQEWMDGASSLIQHEGLEYPAPPALKLEGYAI